MRGPVSKWVSDDAGEPEGAPRDGLAPRPRPAKDLRHAFPDLYADLRRLAAGYLFRERRNHTLQPTALVHEAFLKLADNHHLAMDRTGPFLALVARTMRRILIDHARGRRRDKRGGGLVFNALELAEGRVLSTPEELVALDDALNALAHVDSRKAQVVEIHFFGGLSVAETAEALGCSVRTVTRDWRMAKAWLFRELTGSAGGA